MMVSSQTRNSLIALKEQCQAGGPGVRPALLRKSMP